MVKEAIVTQADNFVDRPYSPMATRIYSGNSGETHTKSSHKQHLCSGVKPAWVIVLCSVSVSAGLFFSNGDVWKRQRRFAMAKLRTFGRTESSMEQRICEESRYLQEAMEREKGLKQKPIKHRQRLIFPSLRVKKLKTPRLFRWAFWPGSTSKLRCGQHHLPDCVRETLWLQWQKLPEHAGEPDRDGLPGGLCLGSGKKDRMTVKASQICIL